MTVEGMAEVDAGHIIEHQSVLAWADSLSTDKPLSVPS
jgi:predicted transcriptional regulator